MVQCLLVDKLRENKNGFFIKMKDNKHTKHIYEEKTN